MSGKPELDITVMVINKYMMVKGKIDFHIAWKKAKDCLKLIRAKLGYEY